MIQIHQMDLSEVPSEVIRLTRPGVGSVMKSWVSEAKSGDSEGIAWLAYEHLEGFLTNPKLVGWAAVVDGEVSIYVKPSERKRGIGSLIVKSMGDTGMLRAKPHNRIGEQFFQKHSITY